MKKKILAICLVVCLAVVAVAGATLAYFTDEKTADNTFTMKGISIDLNEDFEQGSELVPGLDINKDVWVENSDKSSDAYVRVHIAIPAALDDGDPSFNASKNFLHFNFDKNNFVDGQWSWLPEYSEGNGYKGNGAGNWNYYTTEINGIEYAVYVATYRSPLEGGAKTEQVLDKVYLDTSVDAKLIDGEWLYVDNKGNVVSPADVLEADGKLHIHVFAEAAQTATFANAYEALNGAFGVPGTYSPWARSASALAN